MMSLLGSACSLEPPPSVLLEVRDPENLATDAVELAYGTALGRLERADIEDVSFPTRATLTLEEGQAQVAVWVEARDREGEAVARGRAAIQFPEAGTNTASVDLAAVCSRSGVIGARCAVDAENVASGVCALGRCVQSRCGDGIVDSANGEACDDGELLVCAERQLEESEDSCIARLASANDGCDACRFTAWSSRPIVGLGKKGGPATETPISTPKGLDVGPDGRLVFGANAGSVLQMVALDGSNSIVPLVGVSSEATLGRNDSNAAIVRFADVTALDVDSRGFIYVAAPSTISVNGGVFIVDPSLRTVERVVGGGVSASEVDRPLNLSLLDPAGLAVTGLGEIYVADRQMHVLWRAEAGGVTRIAGLPGTECTAAEEPCGEGGAPRDALLSDPSCLALDPRGNLLVCARGRVHRIEFADREPIQITTLAGNGTPCRTGSCGDGGAAVDATVDPVDLAVGPDGEIFILQRRADLRRIDTGGRIETIAGNAGGSFGGDGGPALDASFNGPESIAVAPDGSVYVADSGNHRIRRLTPDGADYVLDTVAGNGKQADAGDGGLVTSARIEQPSHLALLSPDELLILQGSLKAPAIRRLSSPTESVEEMTIETVIGGSSVCRDFFGCPLESSARDSVLEPLSGMAVDHEGQRIFFGSSRRWLAVDYSSGSPDSWTLSAVAGTGQQCVFPALGCGDGDASLEALVGAAAAMAWVPPDTLLVAESTADASRVRRVVLPAGTTGTSWVIDAAAGNGSPCDEQAPGCGDGGSVLDARFSDITDLLYDEEEGHLYIVDSGSHRVRRVTLPDRADPTTWEIETWLGSGAPCLSESVCAAQNSMPPGACGAGGPSLATELTQPTSLVRREDGVFFLTDTGSSRIARIDAGSLSWVAGTGECLSAGDGGPASSASFVRPLQLEVASDGTLFVTEQRSLVAQEVGMSGLVRRIDSNTGVISTIAGTQHPPGLGPLARGHLNQPLDFVLEGDSILIADALGGAVARVNESMGTLLPVAGYRDGRIPSAEPSEAGKTQLGAVLSLHARGDLLYLGRVALSGYGVLEIDTSVQPWQVRNLTGAETSGFADGAANVAKFRGPGGMTDTLDASGLLIADADNHVIRRIDIPSGEVTTVLGTPETRGFSGDGADAQESGVTLNRPSDLVNAGTSIGVYIADTANHRVRLWAPDGSLTTVLGTGEATNAAVGGTGDDTAVSEPRGLSVGPTGDLAVAARDALWLLLAGDDGVATGEDPAVRVPLPTNIDCAVAVEWSGPARLVLSDGCTGELLELQRQRLD